LDTARVGHRRATVFLNHESHTVTLADGPCLSVAPRSTGQIVYTRARGPGSVAAVLLVPGTLLVVVAIVTVIRLRVALG
jgi:hypothetical protein